MKCPNLTLIALVASFSICYAELFTFSYDKNSNSSTKVMTNYKMLRNNCEWIKRISIDHEQSIHSKVITTNNVEDCIIKNVKFDEGDGIIQIMRLGPYITKGKPDFILSYATKLRAPADSLIKFVITAPVDPETGLLFGFPPYHVHHIFGHIPFKSDEFKEEYNIIPYLSRSLKTEMKFFPLISADAQCLQEKGDSDCFLRYLPTGYGMVPHGINRDSVVDYHIEDMRKENSIPISMYFEYAEGFLTKPKPTQKMKPTFDCYLASRGNQIRRTYKLIAKQEMYIYDTYYVPTDSKYMMNDIHGHYANGDEVWIVRGTQGDLNIPLKSRNKVITSADIGGSTIDTPIKVEGMTIEELKQSLETNIKLQRELLQFILTDRFNKNITNTVDTKIMKKKARTSSSSSSSSSKNLIIPYSDETLSTPTKLPEILCKLYAVTEHVDHQYINKMRSKHEGEKNYLNSLSGIEEGSYYRRTLNSQDHAVELGKPQDSQYNQCHEYSIDAGGYLTIIQFNVARDVDYNQHNIYSPAVYMPALNVSMFHGTY